MAAGPRRLPDPVPHVTAHVAPVERALLERARVLDERARAARELPEWELTVEGARSRFDEHIAAEFRTLATELHHWP